MQTSYSQYMDPAIAGTLYDISVHRIDSYAAEGATNIGLGFGVVAGTDSLTQVKVPDAAVTAFMGIALLQAKEQDADGVVSYAAKDTVPVLDQGRAWVPVVAAVTAGSPAYLVHTGENAGKWTSAAGGTAVGVAAAGAATAFAGNAADTGTITAAPATGAGCKAGTYKVICIEPASNGGKFAVEDPDGVTIGAATVGAEFTTHLTFTIADGATDFSAGEGFNITVAAVAAMPVATVIPGAKFKTSTTGAGLAVVELK